MRCNVPYLSRRYPGSWLPSSTRVTYTDAAGREATVATTAPQHPGDIPAGTLRSAERDLEPALGRGLAAMSRPAYRVVVTREDGQWLADVPEL
jgi:hypothetical protein